MLRQIPVLRECEHCGRVDFTAAVCVIVVWASGLAEAVAIVPCLETRVCGTGKCGATHRVVSGEFAPSVHNVRVPQVFQDGARPLDVAQAAALLGWTKDTVRSASEKGDLQHARDHLNAYRISCLAVAAAMRKSS